MSNQPDHPDEQDPPTLPPKGAGEDATLPPKPAEDETIPPAAPNAPQPQDLDTLPQQDTNWRPGGTIRYFGDYELISEIARGGMGVVYRAKQTSLNRIVALKMILAGQLAGEEEVQRFHAEAEAAANLDHPGIVPIYEVGEVEGQHYFSMGYVDGASLSDLIAEQPLEPREAAELTRKVAEAIAYAHEQGVVHRDLKPANVLVQQRTEGSGSSLAVPASASSGSQSSITGMSPRVTDFGLAKQVQGDDQLTASGQILGTPSYMPPEQAAGKIDEIDHRADVYSLGGILYALVTGRPPFQAANQLDTLMQVLEKDPVPPRQLDPKLPRDIETIALKALEKDPRRRYQSATEFAEDLTRFLNGEPIKARSITSAERAWRWAKRKPVVTGLGALAAILLLIVSIGGPFAALQQASLRKLAEDREGEANVAKRAAETAAEKEKAARQDVVKANDALADEKERAERTLYARTISLAYQEWHNDNVHRAEDLLNKASHQYRDWEWDFVKKLCNSEKQTLRGHQGIPFRMRLSADGKRMVSIGAAHRTLTADTNVYLWDMDTGAIIKKLPYRAFAISPDAKRVAVEQVSDGPVVIIDIATEKKLTSIPAHNGGTAWANFNSDGTRLVTTGPDKSVRIWDTTSGEKVLEITDEARRMVHDVNFSQDDRLLVWKTFDGMIQVFDANKGEKVYEIEDRIYRNDAVDVAISPDNQLLAAASNGPINLFQMDTGEKLASLYGHRSSVLSLEFSPDGKRIVSSGVDGTIRIWDVAERRELFRYRGHKFGVVYGVFEVTYSNDGQWIISGGSDLTIKIWSGDAGDGFLRQRTLASADDVDIVEAALVYPDPSQEKDWLVGSMNYVDAVAFSPDGSQVATASEDDTVRVYDLASRESIFIFSDHKQDVAAVAFHPDGDLIASGEGGLNDNRNGKIFVWDKQTGKRKSTLVGHGGPISDLLYHPDGKTLYSATGSQRIAHRGEVFAWDIAGEKLVFRKDDIKGVRDMDLSPDGGLLAIASYSGGILLLDTSTGEVQKTIGGDDEYFFAVAFSKDGKQIVTGKNNWAVAVSDVETGRRLWEKIDHSGAVMGVSFNASGTRVVSTSVDRTTKVWDADSGDMLLDLRGDSFEFFGVAVSPDGNTIASFGEAPYVTLRDLGGDDASVSVAADQQWPVIFADDFDRDELGDEWTSVNGVWEIEDGAAKGTLATFPSIPGFSATTLVPKAWMPSVVEVEFDAWAPQHLLFETKLHDESGQDGLASLFLATHLPMFNNARHGGSLLVQAAGGFNEVSRTGTVNWFKPNQKYRMKTIRRHGRWEMFIDGEPILEGAVPKAMWAPVLHIQGSFANPGAILYIDNIVVRAPESTADEITATGLQWELRQDLKLKSLVIDAIENKTDISESVRKLAVHYAKLQKEDPTERKMIIREMLLAGDRQDSEYGALIDLLQKEVENSSGDWEPQQMLAAAHYRSGDFESALKALREAEREYQRQFAMSHPANMALLALVSNAMSRPQRVAMAMDRLVELMRSDFWQKNANAVAWYEKANEAVTMPEPSDAQLAADIEAIKQLTFKPMQSALCRCDNEEYFTTYSDDAIHIEGRSVIANEHDVETPNPQWVAAQSLFQSGAAAIHSALVRSRADVSVNGDEATLKGDYTLSMPYAHWRWESEFKLRKTDAGWKAYWERRGITGFRVQTTTHISSPDDWARLDAAVEQARKEGDDRKLFSALSTAFRRQEAFEIAKKLTEQPDAAASLWSGLAERAYSVGDADQMLSAASKAVQMKPNIGGAPFIRALAVEQHLPDDPLDVGSGIKVRTPKFIPRARSRDFSVPGKVLRAWYPSDRSGLIIFFAKDGYDMESLTTGMQQIAERFKVAAKVQVHRQDLTEVSGLEATDLIMEGFGTGRSISAPQGKKAEGTVQRWVVAARGKDLIGFLLTAASNEFDQRNAEFQTWLQHVEIDSD